MKGESLDAMRITDFKAPRSAVRGRHNVAINITDDKKSFCGKTGADGRCLHALQQLYESVPGRRDH